MLASGGPLCVRVEDVVGKGWTGRTEQGHPAHAVSVWVSSSQRREFKPHVEHGVDLK